MNNDEYKNCIVRSYCSFPLNMIVLSKIAFCSHGKAITMLSSVESISLDMATLYAMLFLISRKHIAVMAKLYAMLSSGESKLLDISWQSYYVMLYSVE